MVPDKAGQTDGAPVLGYVFPTTIKPDWVGFGEVDGTVALAVTSHPDFDDTPLWDEDSNELYDDDGAIYHAHWVILHKDERAPSGLAVVQANVSSTLPPTAPKRAAGNGAAMRIAALAFFLDVESSKDRQTIRDVCRITITTTRPVGAITVLRAIQAAVFSLESVASELPETRGLVRFAANAPPVPTSTPVDGISISGIVGGCGRSSR